MKMQDKEMDQLFRSKLEGLEIEPSPNVWPAIADRIDAGKKRRTMAWLSVAAGVIILLSAGLYFVEQTTTPVKKQGQVFVQKSENKPADMGSITTKNVKSPAIKHEKNSTTAKLITKNNGRVKSNIQSVKQLVPIAKIEAPDITTELAQISPRREVLRAVVPDMETPLSIKTEIKENPTFITQPDVLTAQLPQPEKVMAAAPAKKHRIRSLGDVINVVISKVDKRKDKLIEFTNIDEDEATITGINLGIIRVKKQK